MLRLRARRLRRSGGKAPIFGRLASKTGRLETYLLQPGRESRPTTRACCAKPDLVHQLRQKKSDSQGVTLDVQESRRPLSSNFLSALHTLVSRLRLAKHLLKKPPTRIGCHNNRRHLSPLHSIPAQNCQPIAYADRMKTEQRSIRYIPLCPWPGREYVVAQSPSGPEVRESSA